VKTNLGPNMKKRVTYNLETCVAGYVKTEARRQDISESALVNAILKSELGTRRPKVRHTQIDLSPRHVSALEDLLARAGKPRGGTKA